ncbi:MAG: hypothetical protein Q7S40_00710 [Opitutaceae bacterium]|nr:hypothetical protein [Opitutaceae bacterium]
MKPNFLVSLAAVAAIGMGAGCGSSQMSRIDRNRDIYELWPIDTRQAVLEGRVESGMTPDMVRVAWGDPSEVVAQARSGDEIWVYKRGGDDGSVIYPGGNSSAYPGGYPGAYPGGVIGGPGIGISTGRGGTSIGATGGVGVGMGGGGTIIGPTGGGMGNAPIITRPTPPEIREVVFRGGVVHRADKP